MKKQTRKNSRHIRWNFEMSSEQDADNRNYVRYHFVVVDDKNREGRLALILLDLSKYSEVIPVRKEEGKVQRSDYRYLFASYDSVIKPDIINWTRVNMSVKRDFDLRERKRGNIEDYVARVYS